MRVRTGSVRYRAAQKNPELLFCFCEQLRSWYNHHQLYRENLLRPGAVTCWVSQADPQPPLHILL